MKKNMSYSTIWIFSLILSLKDVLSLEMIQQQETLCTASEVNINLPCLCSKNELGGIDINCNKVTFMGNFPVLPHRYKIHSFSQSDSGLQSLEAQLFTASDIPLQRIDFSNNLLRRITERTFDGIEDSLTRINLSNNKLGEHINALFSSGEFQRLTHLEELDLSGNGIKDFQLGIFNGLSNLQELKLNKNFFITIPRSAIQNLKTLESLHLQSNFIIDVGVHSFPNLASLRFLNLSSNDIKTIQSSAFSSLPSLKTLILSNNQIKGLDSAFLEGLQYLEHLDLSQNLLENLPINSDTVASLKVLILSGNKIRSLKEIPLHKFPSLENLDLRRNRIYEVPPSTFSHLKYLKELHFDINTVRKVTTEMFYGLENLSELTLNDNRILGFPSEPLNIFRNLKKLNMDYNRIAAISKDILSPINKNKELSLAFNLISEIPDGTFMEFRNLELLNLHGNKISNFSQTKTEGLENSLLYLDVGYNEIIDFPKLNFPNLLILSFAKNKISELNVEHFSYLTKILYLNMSFNALSKLESDLFINLKNMEYLDMQSNRLNIIPSHAFRDLSVIEINLKDNLLQQISESTFENLMKLNKLDLSSNKIETISPGSLNNLPNLEIFNVMGNSLSLFRGDEISRSNVLKTLNLSKNIIGYVGPETFISFRNLEFLDLSFNELTDFSHESVQSLSLLREINLSNNKLHLIGDSYFSNMPHLRRIDLHRNIISSVSEFAFQNSTSLRKIFLQHNKITSLHENSFWGLNRLMLDISFNNINSFSKNVFSRSNGLKLEDINLAGNNIKEFPNEALKKQYSFLERVNISFNKIKTLPSNADVLVNVKELDISYNPLLPDAQYGLLGEPKSLRILHVQGVNISNLPVIESPFLQYLNLKENRLSFLNSDAFERTNMLVGLDLSNNRILDVDRNLVPALMKIPYLQILKLAGNPIKSISFNQLSRLLHLRNLNLCDLRDVREMNCYNLQALPRLRKLQLHGFPSLQNLDIRQCFQNVTSLSYLSVEVMEAYLKDQLQTIFSPKLDTLLVSGHHLRSVSSSAFAGMLSSLIRIQLVNTSIDIFSDKIFLPLPLSSKIILGIYNNKIQRFTQEMLTVLDNKQVDITIQGTYTNPINCDCNIKYFWQWLLDKEKAIFNRRQSYNMLSDVKCFQPSTLQGREIKNLTSSDLVCDEMSVLKSTDKNIFISTFTSTTTPKDTTTHEHPLIIFEQPATRKPSVPFSYIPSSDTRSTLTKVDTMIIGIVAGVVAFVCILIIIICIIRLRRAHPLYTAGPLAGPLAFRAQGKCTCLKPPPNSCTCYPMYSMPYAGRPPLPNTRNKMLPSPLSPPPPEFLTTGQSGRLRNTPYYVTYPDSDNENK